jgi:hypothetical protein
MENYLFFLVYMILLVEIFLFIAIILVGMIAAGNLFVGMIAAGIL